MSDKTQAGWYPSGLRLGERQEEVLRQWPLERIRPKSVSLGVRSLFAEVDALREQLAAKTARIKALEAAGEGMLELLTDHSHGVALSPPAVTQAFGDWLAALSLDYVYVEPSAGPDDAQAGGEVGA